jgi:hypothetical protein
MSRNTGAPASPLARIAARLRERLPEPYTVRVAPGVIEVWCAPHVLAAYVIDRAEQVPAKLRPEIVLPGRRFAYTIRGPSTSTTWPADQDPDAVADSLADALLQKEPPR